jgi:PAS domain S-box-containing protein
MLTKTEPDTGGKATSSTVDYRTSQVLLVAFLVVILLAIWLVVGDFGHQTREIITVFIAVTAVLGLLLSLFMVRTRRKLTDDLKKANDTLEENIWRRTVVLEQQAEDLKHRNAQLRSFMDSTPDLMFFKDTKSNYLGCNSAFLSFLGKTEGDVIGHSDYDIYSADEAGNFRRDDRRVMSSGEPSQMEEWVVFPDGGRKYLGTLKTPIRGTDGEVLGILGISRDLTERKLAEQGVKANEERFKNIFEHMQDGYFKAAMDGGVTLVNRSAVEMLGYDSRENLVGQNMAADIFCTPEQYEVMLCQLKENRSLVDYKTQFRKKSGETIVVSGNVRLVRGSDGQVDKIEGFLRDITARERAEEALLKEIETAQRYLDVAGVMLVVIQADHTVSLINKMGCNILGYSEDDIVGQKWFENFLPPTMKKEMGRLFDLMLQGKAVFKEYQEYPLITYRRDERLISWHHILLRDENGQVNAVLSSGEDVTERRKAESENRKLTRAIEQSPISVVITDRNGTIEYINPYFSTITGYSAEEARGANPRILKSGETPNEDYARLWQTISSGKVWQGELRNRKKNGELFWESATISPITDQTGAITHYIAVKEDITERKKADEMLRFAHKELELTNLELKEASLAKSQFLANMSHEIRTPLNAIIGMTGLLLETRLDPEQRDFADTVRTSGEVLLALINDILDFSKIEALKMELETQSFDLRRCIEEALDLLAPAASKKTLDLAYMMGNGLPEFFIGDVTRLRQVFVNLVSNAIKFTETGEVVISASGQIRENNWYQLHFAVRDTGIGIPPDRLDRLFRSFSQVDTSTTRKYGGTGLGLAISKRLSELMGGSMWVESTGIPGEGSTFHFTIQAQAAPEQPVPQNREVLRQTVADRDVLVVDDSKTNRQILVRQFLSWGMYPTAVASGAEALDLILQHEHYDLAILDMQMPEMDGHTLAVEIHKNIPDLPLVMLSSLGYHEARGGEDHFSAYMTKPIKPAQLFEILGMVLSKNTVVIQKAPAEARFDKEVGQRNPLRILMAEDNVINQKVTQSFLLRLGYRADVVANGQEALDALKRQTYDVVLMDVQMPEMDGETATRIIRTWDTKDQPRIIAMTANALQGDREHYLEVGMDDYVSKPINVDELTRVLRESRARGGGVVNPVPEAVGAARVEEPVLAQAPAFVQVETSVQAVELPAAAQQEMPLEEGQPLVLDPTVLQDFSAMMGENGAEITHELVDLFLKDSLSLINDMKQAIERVEPDLLRRAAHTLKGNSNQSGAHRLAGKCLDLEKLAKTGTVVGGDDLRLQIIEEFKLVEAILCTEYNIAM